MDQKIDVIRKKYLELFSDHFETANGTPFYATDLVIFGLMDRNIGLVESMPNLVESENIHALAPLLRVQLDGLLRLHAFRMVEKSEDLARHIIKGEEIRSFKGRDGQKLTDRHLVNSLKIELPMVESMYSELCGWVHFSNAHIFSALSEGNGEREISIAIGELRKKTDPKLIQEIISAMEAIHDATYMLMEAYFAKPRSV